MGNYRVEVPVWGDKRNQLVTDDEALANETAKMLSERTHGAPVLVWRFASVSYVARFVDGKEA